MRKPNVNKLNETVDKSLYQTVKVTSIPTPIRAENDIAEIKVNQKAKVKLVKFIEKLIRNSFEYREFVSFLRDAAGMDHCAFHSKISNRDSFKIKIELHHSPFTLYDITSIVLEKHILKYEKINELKIAEDVMKLHYQCRVGIIPLSKTVHKLVHNGVIFVPVNLVFGDVNTFIKKYEQYMSTEHKLLLQEHINLSIEFEKVPDKLRPNYIYLDVENIKELERLDVK